METGFWPPDIPFGYNELATVMRVFEDRKKEANRVRQR